MESASVEVILEKIGFGSVQVQLIVIGALILLTALNETLGTSFLLPSACDFSLSTSDKGVLSGMTFLGVTVSSYFWGFLGDTQGRKWVIFNALMFSSIFSITSAFVSNFSVFVACRFMVGVFVSGYSTTLYAYIGEFNTDKHRTTIISWMTVSIGLANIFIPLSAMWILSFSWSFEFYAGYIFRPWRLLMIVYALPGVVAWLWLINFKESPRFLLSRHQNDQAVNVMQWVMETNGRRGDKGFAIKSLELGCEMSQKASTTGDNKDKFAIFKSLVDQTLPLLRPPLIGPVLTCSILHFGTFAISNGVGVFVPDFLNQLSSADNSSKICEVLGRKIDISGFNETTSHPTCNGAIENRVFLDTAVLGVFYTIAFVVLAVAVKFVRRKYVLNFTLLISCIAGFLLTNIAERRLILAYYFAFVIFAGINVSVINSVACDSIPTNLRSMAVCVSMLFGRLGSVITSHLIGHFIENYCDALHIALASLVGVCLLISFLLK